MIGSQYRVVGCRSCDAHWILDRFGPADTAACPTCGREYQRDLLRTLAEARTHEEAVAERAALLADRDVPESDTRTFGVDGDSFLELADRVDERSIDDRQRETFEAATGHDADLLDTLAESDPAQTDRERLWATLAEADRSRTTAESVQAALVDERVATPAHNDALLEAEGIDPDAVRAAVDDGLEVEPEWPVPDPALRAQFPGGDLPLGDVSVTVGPRVSEWAGDLTDQLLDHIAHAVRDRAEARFGADVDGRAPRVWRGWLAEEIGVTALGGQWAQWLSRYALDDAADEEERTALREALTSVVTPGGWSSGATDELVDGPLAAATLCDTRPTVVVRFDALEWSDVRRTTGQRAVDALRSVGRVATTHLVISSRPLADALSRFDLGDVDVTAGFDADRGTQATEDTTATVGDRVERALEELDGWRNGYGRILCALPDDGAIQQRTLADDPTVDLGHSAVSRYLPLLADAGMVSRDTTSRPLTVSLTSLGAAVADRVDPSDGSLRHPDQESLPTEFHAPPHPDVGAVCRARQGREGGRGHSARSVEEWVASTGEPTGPHEFVRWLWGPSARRDEYVAHTRYAAAARGTVTCVDARIREFEDSRVGYLSEMDDEVLAMVEIGAEPLFNLARVANTLLSRKALSKLLTRERVGEEFERLQDGRGGRIDDLEADRRDVLLRGLQVGWLSEEEATWEEFRDRIGGVRALCNEKVAELSDSDDSEARGELMRDLLGLITLATHLYWAADYDLVINVRCPDTANIASDETRRKKFLQWWQAVVPKQAAVSAASGPRSHYRETHEDRTEKRRYRLAREEDEQLGKSDPTVSWVLTGRTATDLRRDIERAIDEEPFEQVAEGLEDAPHLDVDVVDGTSFSSLKGVIRRCASAKGKGVHETGGRVHSRYQQDVERLARLAIAATGTGDRPVAGNPMALAEGLTLIARANTPGSWLTVDDLEQAFAQMDPREFLPDLAPSASRFIQALLASDEPMGRGELMDATGLSTSTWERQRATADSASGPGDLRAAETLGILQEAAERDAFVATLEPWWASRSERSEPQGERPASGVAGGATEADVAFELADALGVELPFDVLAWPPDLETIYREPELYQLRAFIWAAVASGDEYETGPPDHPVGRDRGVVRLGIATDELVERPAGQSSLGTAASSASTAEKLTDGGGEGVR